MYPESRFYFVHSYHVVSHNPEDVLTTTEYGYDFVSAIQHDHIMGAQFHPEKSHKFGMRVYQNFVEFA
jgi:glutamine amidotransferase